MHLGLHLDLDILSPSPVGKALVSGTLLCCLQNSNLLPLSAQFLYLEIATRKHATSVTGCSLLPTGSLLSLTMSLQNKCRTD